MGQAGRAVWQLKFGNMTVVRRWEGTMTVVLGLAGGGRIDFMVLCLRWLSAVCCCLGIAVVTAVSAGGWRSWREGEVNQGDSGAGGVPFTWRV